MESIYKLLVSTSYGKLEFLVTEKSLEIFLKKYFTGEVMQLDGVMMENKEIHNISFEKEGARLTWFDMKPKNERIYWHRALTQNI